MTIFRHYETPADTNRLLGLSCTGVGYDSHATQVVGPRTLGSYAAVWIVEGDGWLETGATAGRLRVEKGTLFWLFPTVPHTYCPDAPGWHEWWALFEGELATRYEDLGFLAPARPLMRVGEAPALTALFGQLQAEMTAHAPFTVLLASTLIHRLILLASQLSSELQSAADPLDGALKRAMALLQEEAPGHPDLGRIAASCGMGYSTFRRRFRRATGYSPKEYVLRLRLRKAKQLLALTNQSVTEVAAAVGFEDPFYFSHLFHAKEGLSPTAFRRSQSSG